MVVSPNQAKESLNERCAAKLEQLEKLIDQELIQNGGARTCVSFNRSTRGSYGDSSGPIPYSVIDNFLDKYRSVGWNAKICNEQREGEWIEFSARTATKSVSGNGSGQAYSCGGPRPYE